ncbi:MAG TPA: cation-transporting P-type ATPase [Syntrophobacteraceae bacterium]|nr:cation-transporting P-type ATPase [Syntrophobacteraceae bacterium]
MVETLHDAITGRTRFRVRELYRCGALKIHLERRLGGDPAVISATANTLTSAVLVRYNSGAGPDRIRSLIEEAISEFAQSCEAETGSPLPVFVIEDGRAPGSRPLRRDPALIEQPLSQHRSSEIQYPTNGRPWHATAAEAVIAALGGSAEAGLTNQAARERLVACGPNRLAQPPVRSKLEIFLNQLNSLPVALLGIAAGISVLTGAIVDALAIMAVVAINSSIGYATETEAERTISSLKTLMHPSAIVIRDGDRKRIDARELVPGDLVILEPGTYVGADCRLLDATRLSIDESSLTGESVPVLKETGVIGQADVPLADRKNIVYMGTLVTGGQGSGIVVATGRFTEIGKLQAMISETIAPQTPMEKQLNTIGNQLVWLTGAICGLVFLTGVIRRASLALIAKTTISLAVAAVPEGLPAVATTTLALGIRKLNAHGVIIRDLEAVETLGQVQTICFDKTGTVTENRMSVKRIFSANRVSELKQDGFFRDGRKISPHRNPDLLHLAKICILCGEAGEKEAEQISSTEKALLDFAVRVGLSITEVTKRYPRIKTVFRTEERHFMATLHGVDRTQSRATPAAPVEWASAGLQSRPHRLLAIKGNPVEVLAMCDRQLVGGKKLPIGEQEISRIELENERMAGDALRVLGFAFGAAEDEETFEYLRGLTWLGLIGMADPLRPGMTELIARFHHAGIDTIMLTGDQSPTAYAIGKELGLAGENPIEILDSTNLTDIDSEALRALSQRVHVFARVSPAHKLQIVQALQDAGQIVAMTGDGINDGPALKAADIGIAMGHGGTDVAREVADVVLEDDNLETMVLAVGHGRAIHNNIKKSLHFILATNLSEILVMFTAGAAGLGYPLNAMQLLWINIISDVFPCLALALEPPEPDILGRPPQDPKDPILGRSDFKRMGMESSVITLGSLGAYGIGLGRYGMGPKASTLAFQSLTLAQLLHSISCRSEKISIYDRERLPPNKYLTWALGGSFGLQLLTFVVPGLRNLLGIAPVNLFDAAIIGISSILPLLVNEATKGRTNEKQLHADVGIGD